MAKVNWCQRARDANLSVCDFIEGQYRGGKSIGKNTSSGACFSKYSPRDGSLLYQYESGGEENIAQAVVSARAAFNDGRWREQPVQKRQAVLRKLADLIEVHREEFALYECLDVGKPISKALEHDIPDAVSTIRFNAEGADKLLPPFGPDSNSFSYYVRKPVGVVGGIIGWNYPLLLAAVKAGPALAMGNSLVLKPSEFTSLSASRLAELALEAGVPAGVFNVVHGTGAESGSALARHKDVDLLTFTGSSATGRQMLVSSGESNMKRLILECGGKSPYLVFEDCRDDLDRVAADVVARAFENQGALCVAGTRVLVQQSIKERLVSKILQQTAKIVPGDPLNPETRFGALMSETQLNKVLSYIDSGRQQGARLLYGGNRTSIDAGGGNVNGTGGGYYIEPGIFDRVDPQYKIAREEIFGPVLCIFAFRDETEAVRMANDTCFGLAAYAATKAIDRVKRLGESLNVGVLKVVGASNGLGENVELSVEPHRQSGLGFEGGLAGLAAYTCGTGVSVLV